MSEIHIVTRSLNLFYQETLVLRNIDAAIHAGQATAIIGPSGCGKTTFLKCLNRMIDLVPGAKVTGKVEVGGSNIYTSGVDVTDVRRRVGLIAQKPTTLPMSIFDNVAFGPRLYGNIDKQHLKELVEGALSTVGLWDEVKDRLKDPANRLSIGQQQRLCLARGLAVEPEILLFDEPTSSLDPASSLRIERVIQQLKDRYTCIVVTHNLNQAKRIADHVLFMLEGELVEHGTAEAVFETPQELQTKAYLTGGDI